MADNYLERHRDEYEKKKALWLLKKKHHRIMPKKQNIERPDDEAL